MNRRQLALILILNALISLAIALSVSWVVEARRPDPEELAALEGAVSVSQGSGSAGGVDLPPTATASSAPAGGEAAPVQPTDTPAAAPVEPAEPAAPTGEEEIYVVQAGDTLSGIATRLGVTMQELMDANNLDNADFVFSGQRLIVPGSGSAEPAPTVQTTTLGTTGLRIRSITGVGSLNDEYVEIVNDTDLNFNLQGWKLQRAGGPEYAFSDVLVFPGGSVRLYSGSGTDTTIARYWRQGSPVWSSGATAILVNAQGERVAEYVVP